MVHGCSPSRFSPDAYIAPFPLTLATTVSSQCRPRRFEICSCKPISEGLPPSLMQLLALRLTLTHDSVSFRAAVAHLYQLPKACWAHRRRTCGRRGRERVGRRDHAPLCEYPYATSALELPSTHQTRQPIIADQYPIVFEFSLDSGTPVRIARAPVDSLDVIAECNVALLACRRRTKEPRIVSADGDPKR